jgi:hypothetical protein
MEQFIFRLLETIDNRANVTGLSQGLGHYFGVIDLIINDEHLSVKLRHNSVSGHGGRF